MYPKDKEKEKDPLIGCFRRLNKSTKVLVGIIHTITIVVFGTLLGYSIYHNTLQTELRKTLMDLQDKNRTKLVPSAESNLGTDSIIQYIVVNMCIRILATLISLYSLIRANHSPASVIAVTAITLLMCILILISGSALLFRLESVSWAEDVMTKSMSRMSIFDRDCCDLIEKIQRNYECCGIEDYKDWQQYDYGVTSLRLPPTCCKASLRYLDGIEDPYCGQNLLPEHPHPAKLINSRGCLVAISFKILHMRLVIGIYCIIVGFLDIVRVIFGLLLVTKGYV